LGPFDIEVPESQRRKGATPSLVLDRADSSIRYKLVTFTEPDEVVLLPESIEMMSVIRGSGAPRLRTTQRFTGYQRFVTGGPAVPRLPAIRPWRPSGYAVASPPAFAHCPSWGLEPPDSPIAPTIRSPTTIGTPPSTGTAPSRPRIRRPSGVAVRAS